MHLFVYRVLTKTVHSKSCTYVTNMSAIHTVREKRTCIAVFCSDLLLQQVFHWQRCTSQGRQTHGWMLNGRSIVWLYLPSGARNNMKNNKN